MIIRDALIAYLNEQTSKTVEKAKCEADVAECIVEEGPVPETARKVTRKTRKTTFGDDTEATSKAREMWAGGERNVTKIAHQFPDYSIRQVTYWFDKEIKSGRLSKATPPSTS
jgi:hypothetical protein